ncbi:hypothetical protein ACS0TY_032665 [Phlomoides rotata]
MDMKEAKARAKYWPVIVASNFCGGMILMIIALTYGTLIVFNPSFHIDNFYVPALNKFVNSTTDPTLIFFDLKIENSMLDVGFRYQAANLTISYGANTTLLGMYAVADFYQGMQKTAHRRGVVMVSSSLPWKEAALGDLSRGSTAEFRVDVAAKAKLKNWLWYFKKRRITAGGKVGVDDTGRKVSREAIELRSGEGRPSAPIVVFWAIGFIILIIGGLAFVVFGVLWCGDICYGNS